MARGLARLVLFHEQMKYEQQPTSTAKLFCINFPLNSLQKKRGKH